MLFDRGNWGRSVQGLAGMGLCLERTVLAKATLLTASVHTKVKGDRSMGMNCSQSLLLCGIWLAKICRSRVKEFLRSDTVEVVYQRLRT